MAFPFRDSTAGQELLIGPLLDASGDPVTGLTITAADILVFKSGATALVAKNSGPATELSGGMYYAVFDATDTDTPGAGFIVVAEGSHIPEKIPFVVLPANVFDSGISASGPLDVNVVEISGDATAADNLGEAYATAGFRGYLRQGTAQAGTTRSITLDSGASSADDFYNGSIVAIASGTGAGQARVVTDYVGSSKVATVGEPWIIAPSSDSVFAILPFGREKLGIWFGPQ